MTILFFHTPHQRLNLISQIQLEIILTHLKAGDDVYIVKCQFGSILEHCVTNHCGRGYYCHTCKLVQDKMYAIASAYGNLHTRDFLPQPEVSIPPFRSVEELKRFHYKQINIGLGVASIVISLVRDHQFDTHKYKTKINQQMLLSMQVVDTLEALVSELKPDVVYTFNGRMSQYAAVVEYCRYYQQPFKVYEFTSRRDAYHIVNNSIPHDIKVATSDILDKWNAEPDILKKEQVGKRFFEGSRQGISMLENSFILAQQDGILPEIDPGKEIITFFNSSIDEFASVPGWEKYILLFEDEVEAIRRICLHYENDPDKLFILRIHPNLKYLQNTQIKKLKSLYDIKNLVIVEPLSKISTYTLIDRSSKVITFGSTVGVEATFWGKPSICLGLAFYNGLDAAYIPQDKKDLYGWIDTKNLLPKLQLNAIKYGYWWMVFGEKFVHRDITYSPLLLELSFWEKWSVVIRKVFSSEIVERCYKLFSITTYRKLREPSFRQALIKEFKPWNKR